MIIQDNYYTTDQLEAYMADKTTVRLVFAIYVRYILKRRILDINCAFPHDKAHYREPSFVLQPRRFDGSLKQKGRVDRLRLNHYGGLPV